MDVTPRTRIGARFFLLCVLMLSLVTATLAVDAQRANGANRIKLYDTAWDMAGRAELSETDAYFTHIAAAGFDGVYMSYLNLSHGGVGGQNPSGDVAIEFDADGDPVFTSEYAARVRSMLDQAYSKGLRVGLAPVWAARYQTGPISNPGNEHCGGPAADRFLTTANAADMAEQIDALIGNHPALEFWILGGDNFCVKRRDALWKAMGTRLDQLRPSVSITYHGLPSHRLHLLNEPWLDFAFLYPGHCATRQDVLNYIAEVQAVTNKPVWISEGKYEDLNVPWCGQSDPISPQQVLDNVRASVDGGAVAFGFGHADRWKWAEPIASLGSPAEQLVLNYLGGTSPPPPPPPPPPNPTTCIARASGDSSVSLTWQTDSSERRRIRRNNSWITTLEPSETGWVDSVVPLGSHSYALLLAGEENTDCGTVTLSAPTPEPPPRTACAGRVVTVNLALGEQPTNGDDVILGTAGDDAILGLDGNDVICGLGGNDRIWGGAGRDRLVGGAGRDRLYGGPGPDDLFGKAGIDRLMGEGGNDRLIAGLGDDILVGGRGRDPMRGGPGSNVCTPDPGSTMTSC